MWVFTPDGFYSVVAHRSQRRRLIVRCRVEEDMDALRQHIPGLEVFEDEHADYRWRAIVTKREWKRALARMGEAIDYDNFKNEVTRRQGDLRHDVYMRVWSAVLTLQQGGRYQPRQRDYGPTLFGDRWFDGFDDELEPPARGLEFDPGEWPPLTDEGRIDAARLDSGRDPS